MTENQKASWVDERFAMARIKTVKPTGNNSIFIQDLPLVTRSPIIMPQKIHGMTSATTSVVLMVSQCSLRVTDIIIEKKKGSDSFYI